jgi:hypothetical protein
MDGYEVGRDLQVLSRSHSDHVGDAEAHAGGSSGIGEDEVRAIVASMLLEHDSAEGAHAPAFAAHDMSPGAVEEAEELAEEILSEASDQVAEAVDAIGEVAGAAAEPVEEAAEAVSDVVQIPVDEIQREREPLRVHPLHRRVGRAG